MKNVLKSAVLVSMVALGGVAQAATFELDPVLIDTAPGFTFSNVLIGTITVGSVSNVSGWVFALDTVVFDIGTFSLQPVVPISGGISALTDTNPAPASFSYLNVAAGTYNVWASGTLVGSADFEQTAFVGAKGTISPIPEPQSYALFLAGLGAVCLVMARRRSAD